MTLRNISARFIGNISTHTKQQKPRSKRTKTRTARLPQVIRANQLTAVAAAGEKQYCTAQQWGVGGTQPAAAASHPQPAGAHSTLERVDRQPRGGATVSRMSHRSVVQWPWMVVERQTSAITTNHPGPQWSTAMHQPRPSGERPASLGCYPVGASFRRRNRRHQLPLHAALLPTGCVGVPATAQGGSTAASFTCAQRRRAHPRSSIIARASSPWPTDVPAACSRLVQRPWRHTHQEAGPVRLCHQGRHTAANRVVVRSSLVLTRSAPRKRTPTTRDAFGRARDGVGCRRVGRSLAGGRCSSRCSGGAGCR